MLYGHKSGVRVPLNEIKEHKELRINGAHFCYIKTHLILYSTTESCLQF